jgi:phospholipid/cholesterol/gamma-HCH transport system substrate-binding protein
LRGKIETQVGVFVLAALAVFAYMGFQIGAFRLDRGRYVPYVVYFKDLTGLARKADVRIAGVKVGWVETIHLLTEGSVQAEASVLVDKQYTLHQDAHAVVRQQGLLGPNYLELVPGDPLLPALSPGQALSRPSRDPVGVDELLQKFKSIADNVEVVTASLKDAVGGDIGQGQIRGIIDNLSTTAQKFASFSESIDKAVSRNEGSVDSFLRMGENFERLSKNLESDILPAFKNSIEKISTVFDRDFNRVASKLESTTGSIEEAALQARDGFKSISAVADKINDGKGLLGKLVNDDEPYRDLKVAVKGLRNYLAKMERLQIVFDAHVESMHRPAENYNHCDSKGYFDIRIHPTQDYFYQVEMVNSEKGWRNRVDVDKAYNTTSGRPVDTDTLVLSDANKLDFVYNKKIDVFTRNTIKFGLQFGKAFKDVALRFGLFEGSAGVACDVDFPFKTDKFRWVSSVEMFDFSGWNRKHDRRPHLKWLNSVFFMRNLYFTFGADDFASKRNANIFFGAGIRFGDDSAKLLLSSGGAGMASGLAESNLGLVVN